MTTMECNDMDASALFHGMDESHLSMYDYSMVGYDADPVKKDRGGDGETHQRRGSVCTTTT